MPTRSAWNLIESKFLVPAIPLTRWSVAVFAPQRDAPPPAVVAFFQQQLLKQAALRGVYSRYFSLVRCVTALYETVELWFELLRLILRKSHRNGHPRAQERDQDHVLERPGGQD